MGFNDLLIVGLQNLALLHELQLQFAAKHHKNRGYLLHTDTKAAHCTALCGCGCIQWDINDI